MSAALKKIHVARRQLGLDEDTYRDLLERETGQRSAKGLDEAAMGRVLKAMEKAGWKPSSKGVGKTGRNGAKGLSGPYAAKLRALWIALHNLGAVRNPSDAALLAFVKRQVGIERTEWLRDPEHANRVIEALKGWCEREGVDWYVGEYMQDFKKQPGYQIARAQFAKIEPYHDERETAQFWARAAHLSGKSVKRMDGSDWIAVMNRFGERIRRRQDEAAEAEAG